MRSNAAESRPLRLLLAKCQSSRVCGVCRAGVLSIIPEQGARVDLLIADRLRPIAVVLGYLNTPVRSINLDMMAAV